MKLPLDQILHGNCIEVMRSLPDCSVDLIFADPPYNLQLRGELLRPNQTVVDAVTDPWDHFSSLEDYDRFTREWLAECRRVLKDTGTLWVIGTYHNIYRVGTALMDLDFWILNDAIWEKANPMPNFRGTRFTNATETLLWVAKSEKQKYTFNYQAMKHLNGDKQMRNVWRIPLCTGAERIKVNGRKAHSTQKPEALLYRVLLASSNPGDVVLDPFLGSGTTAAVAKRLGRHFIGIERDSLYVEVARGRVDRVRRIEDPLNLTTPSRRRQPRVAFGRLLEAGYLLPGQALFDHSGQTQATIKLDSHLICGNLSGSIHKLATQLMGRSANGWDFWHYQDDSGALVCIDELRSRYREEFAEIVEGD